MTKHSEAPDWTYQDTQERLLSIPDMHYRGFACLSYVGGLRINEAMDFQPKNISIIDTKLGPRILFRVRNEKNPNRRTKDMPVNPLTEREYLVAINDSIYQLRPEDYPFKIHCERTYRSKIRRYLDIHPHALRHLRVHHIDDKTVPGMSSLTPRQYQDYFGWESIATSSKYQSRTRSKDLSEMF